MKAALRLTEAAFTTVWAKSSFDPKLPGWTEQPDSLNKLLQAIEHLRTQNLTKPCWRRCEFPRHSKRLRAIRPINRLLLVVSRAPSDGSAKAIGKARKKFRAATNDSHFSTDALTAPHQVATQPLR
jgi:hypothetical protein